VRLTRTQGKKSITQEIKVEKKQLITHECVDGTWGKEKKKSFPSPQKARAAFDKRVAELQADGFADPAMPPPPPTHARDAKLEATIRADRESPDAYAVYADWLQQHGNPLGELIVLAQQKPKAFANKLGTLGLPDGKLATYGWRHGMWQWIRLENRVDWMDSQWDPNVLGNNVFAQTACAALEELQFGVVRWDHNFEDVPMLIAEAGKHAWAKDLTRLHVGAATDIDLAHYQAGVLGKPISKAFPKLEWLKVRSGEAGWRGTGETFSLTGLALPELRELTVETCSMSKQRLAGIIAAKLPKLERLTLWFGSEDYGADASVKSLTKLLDGSAFPKLRHLGLMNAEFENEIAVAVSTSKLARQLESLDLSMGTMTEVGADALIAGKKNFGKLKALNVRDNFLSKQSERAVKKAFPFATVDGQKEADNSIEGETHYYVSQAE
jgi:uncharacterized protein (TIGR02996 family)